MTTLGNTPTVNAPRLASIQTRTRLMVGDRDAVVSVEETVNGARGMPDAECAILPGTPHPLEQVRVALLASMIRDFLQ